MAGPWEAYQATPARPTAPDPARPTAPDPARPAPKKNLDRWNKIPQTEALQIYMRARHSIIRQIQDPTAQARAFQRFDSDPRTQKLRQVAGLQSITTRRAEIARAARESSPQSSVETAQTTEQRLQRTQAGERRVKESRILSNPFTDALDAGIKRSLFGIPERIGSAIQYYTGIGDDSSSYQEALTRARARTDRDLAGSTSGNILGQIGGSVVSGKAVGGAVGWAGGKLAGAASPIAARAGNVLQSLTNLQRGQGLKNAGRLVVTGGAGGAAQAAGEGSSIPRGAAYGAGGALALGAGFKVVQWATRPFRDFLRTTSAARILNRLTTTSRDQLEARAREYRTATGAEPTLFEILPLADRNRILGQTVVGRDNVVEQASDAIRARAANLGPEMSARAGKILQPQRDIIERGVRGDLATARGGSVNPEDAALAARAVKSPTDMSELRDVEARAIMSPHENTPIVNNLEDLYPSVPAPRGGAPVLVDPEVATVIRSAAGTLRARPKNAGVTAGDITDMISTLRSDLGKGGIEGRTAERAINHLQDTLDEMAPDAGAAAREMSDAYAARSRMAEGMREGAATRLRDDIQVGTSRREARRVRNAYDTPEGAAGRSLGQGNRVLGDLAGSPEEALRATVQMSRNSTGRQLGQNVGTDEAEQIMAAARAQDTSAQALSAASQTAKSGSGEISNTENLVQSLVGLHPSSFITTKIGAMRRLMDMTYIPENRARVIVDMVFSQNPAMVQRALNAVGNQQNGQKFMQYLVGVAGMLSAGTGDPSGEVSAPDIGDLGPEKQPVPEIPEELRGAPQPMTPGNLPLDIQNQAQNEDGSVSTVRTISIGTDQGEVLIPTVIDGRVVSDEEAIQHFRQTGENFGTFRTSKEADAYAGALHNYHSRLLGNQGAIEPGPWDEFSPPATDENYIPYGRRVIESMFPGAVVTEDNRDPDSDLGRANPGSKHNTTDGAVDVRPIPGMEFDDFIAALEDQGHNIIEAIDEVNNPSAHATGPHWHVVFG